MILVNIQAMRGELKRADEDRGRRKREEAGVKEGRGDAMAQHGSRECARNDAAREYEHDDPPILAKSLLEHRHEAETVEQIVDGEHKAHDNLLHER